VSLDEITRLLSSWEADHKGLIDAEGKIKLIMKSRVGRSLPQWPHLRLELLPELLAHPVLVDVVGWPAQIRAKFVVVDDLHLHSIDNDRPEAHGLAAHGQPGGRAYRGEGWLERSSRVREEEGGGDCRGKVCGRAQDLPDSQM